MEFAVRKITVVRVTCAKEFSDSNFDYAVIDFSRNCPRFHIFTKIVIFQVYLEFRVWTNVTWTSYKFEQSFSLAKALQQGDTFPLNMRHFDTTFWSQDDLKLALCGAMPFYLWRHQGNFFFFFFINVYA